MSACQLFNTIFRQLLKLFHEIIFTIYSIAHLYILAIARSNAYAFELNGDYPEPLFFNEIDKNRAIRHSYYGAMPQPPHFLWDKTKKRYKMNTKEILETIKNGEMTEKYDEWKNNKTHAIRAELATQGYFPEHFINDRVNYVRNAVADKHPEYLGKLLRTTEYKRTLLQRITHESNLNDETIEETIKAFRQYRLELNLNDADIELNCHLLHLKKKAQHQEITPIEATMSDAQLYASKSILWYKNYSLSQIKRLRRIGNIKNHDIEELESLFQRENLNDFRKHGELIQQYRNRRRAEEKKQ